MTSPAPPTHQEALSNYTPGHQPTHITNHTLRTASNSAPHLLPRLAALLSTTPHLTLLDVGAGPGTLSASLAHHLAPHGHVTACDLSAAVLAQAATHAAAVGVADRMAFVPADAAAGLPFADASFDVVHVSQVLVHLSAAARGAALREMWRVLRPGGTLSLREVDMRSWSYAPGDERLDAFHELLRRTMEARGGARDLGPRLCGVVMAEVGVERARVQMGMGTWCYSEREEKEAWAGAMTARLRDGEMRRLAVERGFATEVEMDGMIAAWEEWTEREESCIGCLHGELLATK